MARFAYILAIWTLAISLGILGYQGLTWYFYNDWPAVSVAFGWHEVQESWYQMFGDFWFIPSQHRWQIPPGDFRDALHWLGRLPIVAAGIVLAYLLFLLSDARRGRFGRLRRP